MARALEDRDRAWATINAICRRRAARRAPTTALELGAQPGKHSSRTIQSAEPAPQGRAGDVISLFEMRGGAKNSALQSADTAASLCASTVLVQGWEKPAGNKNLLCTADTASGVLVSAGMGFVCDASRDRQLSTANTTPWSCCGGAHPDAPRNRYTLDLSSVNALLLIYLIERS